MPTFFVIAYIMTISLLWLNKLRLELKTILHFDVG